MKTPKQVTVTISGVMNNPNSPPGPCDRGVLDGTHVLSWNPGAYPACGWTEPLDTCNQTGYLGFYIDPGGGEGRLVYVLLHCEYAITNQRHYFWKGDVANINGTQMGQNCLRTRSGTPVRGSAFPAELDPI